MCKKDILIDGMYVLSYNLENVQSKGKMLRTLQVHSYKTELLFNPNIYKVFKLKRSPILKEMCFFLCIMQFYVVERPIWYIEIHLMYILCAKASVVFL